MPTITYTFGIVKWSDTDIGNIERTTRVLLTKYQFHHPNSATERVTLPRAEGGRGLVDLRRLYSKLIKNLQNYFLSKESSPLHQIVTLADNGYTPLDLLHSKEVEPLVADAEYLKTKLNQWASKPLHGRIQFVVDAAKGRTSIFQDLIVNTNKINFMMKKS
ncbi:unnamed protein product [Parnassius mnemosyne]|uniref:DDE-1 domain-containing protein n=1 Tax=Parnassius mnemosyne TaxID=213953 RepID=A0AAV1LM26_9NEOP